MLSHVVNCQFSILLRYRARCFDAGKRNAKSSGLAMTGKAKKW